ncbi:MAG: glycosyltransferase family A protein [Erythrobacter sp.]|uniref:glycosyltransferase family 2 protein n=1 Tax=Erythrobacter sp. TaxID=1042 RepID=UPI0032EDAAAD
MIEPVRETIEQLVSVIIPTFNRRDLVQDALASIAAQSWHSIEVIVIDDGSDDGTGKMIADLIEGSFPWPITYRWQANQGAAVARNHGRSLARGAYLYHLDSDDVAHPEALSDLVAAIERAGAQYAVGLVANTDLGGVPNRLDPVSVPRVVPRDIVGSGWYTHAALYRRELVEAVGGYSPAFDVGEDAELHWRILAKAGSPGCTDTLVADRRIHGHGQLSEPMDLSARKRVALALLEHMHRDENDILATTRNRLRVFLMGSEFGARADWSSKERARVLLGEMSSARPILRRLSNAALAPKSRLYYRILKIGLACIRGTVPALYRFGWRSNWHRNGNWKTKL